MSILSHMIAWGGKAKYWLSREYCYDEMEEKGYASQGRCCGLLGGDSWSDNTMYMCIDCLHYTPIIGGKLEGNMKRLTEYTIPETGFSVVSEERYKRILMEEKPSVEKVYNRLKKIEDILGDEYELADVAPVRHGRWKNGGNGLYDTCTACGKEIYLAIPMNYCPECGALMGKEDEHD